MNDNDILINIKADIQGVDQTKSELDKLAQSADKLPDQFSDIKTSVKSLFQEFQTELGESGKGYFDFLPKQLESTINSMIRSMQTEIQSIQKSMNGIIDGKQIGDTVAKDIQKSMGYLTANMKTMFSSAGSIGRVFSGISDDMRKEFTANLSDMSRDIVKLVQHASYSSGLGAQTDSLLQKALMSDKGFGTGYSSFGNRFGLSKTQQDDLLKGLIQAIAPVYNRQDYINQLIKASGGQIKHIDTIPTYSNFKERLPQRFQNIPDNPRLSSLSQAKSNQMYQGNLTQAEYNIVKHIARTNPSFEQALTMAGVATRGVMDGRAGTLIMPGKPISRIKYAQALGYLDKDILRPALESAPMYYRSIAASNYKDQVTLANKNSKIPAESYNAFYDLRGINVDPLYTRKPSNTRYTVPQSKSVVIDSGISIRPNQYQIMALTYDDFIAGKIPDSKAPKRNAYDERVDDVSVHKMVQQSLYTDLLGMFGHQTYGNGSKTKIGTPKMIQLNLADRIYKKDPATGGLVFGENGIPVADEDTLALISSLFKPNKTITTSRGTKYGYPSTTFGKFGTYVPTNIKNGIITLAEESAYVKASTPFLERFGVNIFDNLVGQDTIFDSVEALNKPIEARNRMLTPGVPFSKLGGRMPSKDRVAFVDLETLTGHNGSSFFMPGYLPGGDLTLRSVGFKGLGQTVDYKQMIRDLYGKDTTSFYVPFMNAPENIKTLFKEKGIDAVRAAYQNETTRNQHGLTGRKFEEDFLDIMNYDALITSSMIKTPIYKKARTNAEVADTFYAINEMIGGMRGVKTAGDFYSRQKSLSQQVARNLLLSPEEAAANQEKWNQYINDLMHNPAAIKKYLFSDPNDELSKKVQENESLMFSDNEARNRINEAIASARISQMYNEMYSPGGLSMRVAMANPAEQILRLGRMNNADVKRKKLAEVLGMGYYDIGGQGKDVVSIPGIDVPQNIRKLYREGGIDAVRAAFQASLPTSGLRYPNNVTEQYSLELSKRYAQLASHYGLNKDGIYLNMATISKMGGGDVDGDTVQIIQGELANVIKRTFEDRTQKLGGYKAPNLKKAETKFDKARTSSEQDFADLLYRQATASFQMGAVENAAKALEQGNWDDPVWVSQVAKGGIDLKAMYDIDSTFQKSGILADWTAYANRARQMGRPFSSVFKDMQGAVNEGDYSRLGNFSKINFPSAYSALTVSMLNALKNNPISDEALDTMIRVQSDLQGIPGLLASGDPINVAKAKFLNKNNDLFAQLLTGRGQALATSSVEDLGLLLGQWNAEIEKAAPFAKYDKARSDFINQQRKEYQAQLNRYNHLNQFGLTQARIERGEGYGASKLFSNARYTDDSSAYYTAKAKEDEAALRAAIVSGAHPMVVESLANSSEAELAAIAAAKSRADSRTYSWSMINTLQHGASGPENWYKQYIQDIKQPETRETLLGSAAHAALEAWATNRKNNNSNYGTSEEYEKAVNDYLLKNKGFFPELPTTGSPANFTQKQIETYQNILAFARNLPNLFRDEQIVGFEKQGGEVHPNFGYKRSSPNERLNSIGYIDLVTRDAEGNLIKTDLKPRLGYPRVWEQLDTYNPERDARYKRVLSYGERDYSDPSKYIEKKEYKEEEIAKTETEMQQVVSRIQDFAALGNPISQLTQTFADVIRFDGAGSAGSTFSQFQSRRQHVFDEMSYQQQEEDIAKQEQDQVFKDYEQDRLEISKNTGIGIAKAMALQTDMHDYVKQLDEMTSNLASRGRKLQDPNKLSDMWAGYEYQLDELFNRRKLEFQARGASDAEIGLLDQSRNAALSQLEATRSIAAYSDIDQLTQSLNQKIQENNTSSPIRNYVKEFNDLTISIEKATQAYSQLQEDINKKKENNTPVTEDELKNLEKAEASNVVMHQTADQYRQLLSENLSKQIQQQQDSLLQLATGQPLSIEQDAERKTAVLAANINKQKADLNLLYDNNLISKDNFDKYISQIDNISLDNYKQQLIDTNKLLEEQRRLQKDAQIDQFLQQGKQLEFNSTHGHSNDIATRLQREQMSIVSQYTSYIRSGQTQIKQLEQERIKHPVDSDEYKKITKEINTLNEAVTQASQSMHNFEGASGLANIALQNLGAATANVIKRFGHQMFQKAITEAKRFVQEYDKDMTTIQMITLKSDSEIDKLGQSLIQKAVDMRASVSETTSAAGELYRQGLSDEEVNTRLEDVIKFSKVAGIKTTEASKIITTALQNGLVDSSEDAMDALVALGDSAATTASEIAKGMQKTAASAKQAGVSYSQLVTLLTIGTSKTQLGGSAIGSALQTLFYRLQKVGKKEDFYDENGKHIASNDAMKAIEGLGISAFDTEGNMRNPYEVLVDIASKWDTADDVTQSKILTTLGAGRQRSNVATLIQGLSEDNGELAGKYNDLASNSKGITDEKYQEYLKSLEASITSVKTSFDQLIASFNAGSTASTVLGFIAELIQGFTAVNTALGGMPSLITAIAVAAAGLIALFKFSTPIGWITTIAAGAATVIGGIGSMINYNKKAEEERKQAELEASPEYQAKEKYEKQIALNQTSHGYESLIEETRKLGEQYNTLGENMDQADLAKFESNLKTLTARFPELGVAISADSDLLKNWSDIVNGASLSVEQFHRLQALQAADEYAKTMFADDIEELNTKVNEIKNAKDEISSSMKDLQEKGLKLTEIDEVFGAVGEYEKVKETKSLNQDYSINNLLSDLKACQELCNSLANSDISPNVNQDASEFVSSMSTLLESLNGMPKEGYDLTTSFEGLDLSQLEADSKTISDALALIKVAAESGFIDETTASQMSSSLEAALNVIKDKINQFNTSGDNTVEVNAEAKTEEAEKDLQGLEKDRNSKYHVDDDGSLAQVKQDADSLDTDHYSKFNLDTTEADEKLKKLREEVEALNDPSKWNIPKPEEKPEPEAPTPSDYSGKPGNTPSTASAPLPSSNNTPSIATTPSPSSSSQVYSNKAQQTKFENTFEQYAYLLAGGSVKGIQDYLDRTGTYLGKFVEDFNSFVSNNDRVSDDYIIQAGTSQEEIKQTINKLLFEQFGLISSEVRDTFVKVAEGLVARDFTFTSSIKDSDGSGKQSESKNEDSSDKQSEDTISLVGKLFGSLFNNSTITTSESNANFITDWLGKILGIDASSAIAINRTWYGGYSSDRSISLDELSNLLNEKNVENADPLWLALNSTKLKSNKNNERFINYEGYKTNIVFDEKKFEEALRFIYAYDLTTSGNHMFNTSSYNNADEFVADWNNGFSNFSFVQGLEGTDPKTYILGLLQKLLTGANEGDWSDYDVNMDKMVEELYTGMFATIIKKYPVDKVITGDYAGYSDLIMENIGKKILDDHEGQKLADWFNPSDILTQIFSYLNEFSLDPEAYIKDLKVETVKTSSSLLQTAIGAFETKNDSQISADKLYKELLGSEVKNLNDVMNLYDKGELKDLATVILDDQKGILGQVLAAFTEETEDGLKVIDENGVGLQAFLAALAGLTNLYKDAANETLSNIAVEAKDYLDNRTSTSYDSFKSLVGASLAIKYQNGETISPIETSYVNDIINNAANGISGLTDMQQYEGIRQLVNLVSSGGFDYNSIDSKVLGAYTSGSKTLNDYLVYSSKLTEAGLDASKLQNMSPMTDEFEEYDRVLKAAGTSARSFIETQKQLDQELATVGVTAVNEYGSQTKEVTSIIASMKGSTQSAIQEQQKLNKLLSSAASNQYYRNQWRSGKRDKETYEAIAGMLNIDKGQIDVIGEELINNMLESLSNLDLSQIQTYGYAIGEMMTQSLQDAVANEKIDLTTAGIDVHNGPVTLNIGETLAKLGGILDEETEALLKLLQQWGVDAAVKIEEDADGNIKARIQIKTVGSGRGGGQYRSGAGSGGSGNKGSAKKEKTPAEKLTEALKNRQTLWDHRIKMVQFQQTHYEEDDQLGNYGRMIEAENAIRKEMGPALEENLRELKAEFAQTAQNTKEWYTLRDAILSAEEAIEDNNQAIEKNNKKLKQNEYNIHKRRIELEDLVREEIKRRIQEERDKVQGFSDLEKEIYNIIKSNYEKQWQLIKDDIDKKKEALNEEKNLINERLNARKKAEDTASKYEQLAEYKKQLALIQMDKTRTKEAAALRKKIAELQGTIGWNIAEEEAKNQQDEIDQQVKAYDDYEKQGDKALNDFLSDANNLAAEIKQVMSLNHDDLIIWLKTNSDDYKNSLENTRQTIQFGWDDLFNKAHGIVETFNEQIAAILTNQETYIEFMSQSSEYLRATSDAQANMVQDWLDKYDAWYKTQDHSATYVHYDNNYYSDGTVNSTDDDSGSSGGSGGGGGGSGYSGDYIEQVLPISTQSKKVGYVVYDEKGFKTNLGGTAESEDAALESLKKAIGKSTYYSGSTDGGTSYHVKREHAASYDGKIGYGDSKESAKNALLNQLGRTVQDYLYNNSSLIQYDYSYVGVTKYKDGTVNEERLDSISSSSASSQNSNNSNGGNNNVSTNSNADKYIAGTLTAEQVENSPLVQATFDNKMGFGADEKTAREELYTHLSDAQKRYANDHPSEIGYANTTVKGARDAVKQWNAKYNDGKSYKPTITEYPVNNNNNEDGIIDLNADNNSNSGNSGSSGGSSDSQASNTITRGNNGNTRPSYRGNHGWIAQNDKGIWLYAYGFGSQRAAKADLESVINNASSTKAEYYRRSGEFYKNGGLVDYTGPAWVDGTPSAPEAFLSAPDTKLMRNFLDALSYVPNITRFDPSMFMGNYTSGIDNISIVINEATINDELDMEILAEKIGQQFNRELEKQGFSTAKYRF